ncbi:MAG: glycoside hydrolase family 10 protein [Massiliimalia sp.]
MKGKKRILAYLAAMLCAFTSISCKGQGKDSFYPVAEFPPANVQYTETGSQEKQQAPLNYETMKGVWISYLEYSWALKGKTQAEFEQTISAMFDQIVSWGLNTVIVQVRSHGDAYYPSQYYPWSQYASGSVGVSPGFDPLAIMVEQAHQRNLSIHGWINPYRLMMDEGMNALSEEYLISQWYHSPGWAEYMQQGSNGYWYLNPGNEQALLLIVNGVSELVSQYSLDGIQIDDYFYTISPEVFGQTAEQARENTTKTVKGIYEAVHQQNDSLWFGVSPAGNYLDIPKSDQTQYTDLVTWCTQEGYLDYVSPQIYWDFDDPVAPFQTVLEKWENLVKGSPCRLFPGLAAYKFSGSDHLWDQAKAAEEGKVSNGYLYFRYDDLVKAFGG